LKGDSSTRNSYLKIKSYLNDSWNYLDIFGCLIFSIGMVMRFAAFFTDGDADDLFTAAR
jgi:hypothetical protein